MTNLEIILQKVLQELNNCLDLSEENIMEKLKNSVQNLEINEPNSFDQDSKETLKAFFCSYSGKQNFNPDYPFTRDGNSLSHLAVKFGSVNVLKVLISMGADINLQNKYGDTPLHCNILYINTQILQNLNAILQLDKSKVNPVRVGIDLSISVAAQEDLKVVKILLSNGARIDIQNQSGKTPLHLASKLGLIQVTNILLNHQSGHSGSDKAPLLEEIINTKDKSGHTALYYAYKNKNWELMKLLKNHGANTSCISSNKAYKVGLYVGLSTGLVTFGACAALCIYESISSISTTSKSIVICYGGLPMSEEACMIVGLLAAVFVIGVLAHLITYGITYTASEHSLNSKLSKVDTSEIEKHNSQNVTEDKNQHNASTSHSNDLSPTYEEAMGVEQHPKNSISNEFSATTIKNPLLSQGVNI